MNKIRLLKFTRGLFISGVLLLFTQGVLAQNIQINGSVVSATDNTSIIGATVRVKGLSVGTITDIDGNFKISAPKNSTLIVSYIGYEQTMVDVPVGNKSIKVVLKETAKNLEEVVVIGYGTQRKKEVTGSVVQLSSEALSKASSIDIGSAMQGQIAGVNVQASSGRPGDNANIQIRGLNTVTGTNAPLFVVDGIPYDSDPQLSMSEIATIDVLKDAASASIYGTRGAGGVILITTKQGKAGTMKISAESYYGIQHISSNLPLLNTVETITEEMIYKQNNNGTYHNNSWSTFEQNPNNFTNETDLTKVFQRANAPVQNHSVSISGGKEGLTYNVVSNFFKQDGVLINSGLTRFTTRANTSFKKGKWLINTGIGFKLDNQTYEAWGMLLDAYKYKPYQVNLDPNVSIFNEVGAPGSNAQANLNSVAIKLKQTDERLGDSFNANLQIQYNLSKWLDYKLTLGGSANNNTRERIVPTIKMYDIDGVEIPSSTRSSVYNSSDRSSSFTVENSLNYQRKFGAHQIKVLGLISAEKYQFTSFYAQKFDLQSNQITTLEGALRDPNVGTGNGWNQNKTNTLVGILGRVQYDYKSKYLVSVSARRDGSSRFAEINRWGTFPSASIGWNVSEEDFFKPISNVVSSMKIRSSIGTTGNQNFLDYSYAASIVINKDYPFGTGTSEYLVSGATQTGFANTNVQWETTTQKNIGIDLAFIKNSLTFTADVYQSNKTDMLFPLLLPVSAGAGQGSTVTLNVGDMTNKGIELASSYRHNGKFSWTVGGTFSRNINEITRMSGTNKFQVLSGSTVADGVPNVDRVAFLKEGYEAGAFFVVKTDGIVRTADELVEYQKFVPTAKLGDLRYVDALTVDTDGDGVPDAGDKILDDNDRVYAGSGAPIFTAGLNISCNYNNFDFSMQWYESYGSKIINGNKIYSYMYATNKDLLYQWTPQNVDAPIPANRGRDHANYRGYSDIWIQDGSFLRLKNIALGYSLPSSIIKKLGVNKLRLYISSQNPITITKYDGFDPEVGNDGLSSRGIDKGSYPMSAQYRGGIQLEF